MAEDNNFGAILEVLNLINFNFPDLRFGQVIQIALDTAGRRPNIDLNDCSSKYILKCLNDFYLNLNNNRRKGTPINAVAKYSRTRKEFILTKEEYIEKLKEIEGITTIWARKIADIYPSERSIMNMIKCKVPLVIDDKNIKELLTKHYLKKILEEN